MFHELMPRDHEDGRATAGCWLRGVPERSSQEPTPEDARKDGHICGRSR
jgi:hypothetical protein